MKSLKEIVLAYDGATAVPSKRKPIAITAVSLITCPLTVSVSADPLIPLIPLIMPFVLVPVSRLHVLVDRDVCKGADTISTSLITIVLPLPLPNYVMQHRP